jgi:hypothetical protein
MWRAVRFLEPAQRVDDESPSLMVCGAFPKSISELWPQLT